MIETLLVPGLNGSGPGHWQREWLKRDPDAAIVEQEDWASPDLVEWLHRLEAHLEAAPGAVLVAHSLGCALVASLAGRPSSAHVAGALMVAPADLGPLARAHPGVAPFIEPSGRRLPFTSILVASRNDPYLRFPAAEALARRWGSAVVDLGEAGHVNVASGHGFWPDGVILAEGLRGRATLQSVEMLRRWRAGWRRFAALPAGAHDVGLGVN